VEELERRVNKDKILDTARIYELRSAIEAYDAVLKLPADVRRFVEIMKGE